MATVSGALALRHDDVPVLVRESSTYERVVKPLFDRLGAVLLMIALAPVLALVALVVLVTLGRPILYRQERVGQDGAPFEMLKFRTMEPDRRDSQLPFDGPDRRTTHKTLKDPRHTRLGRFLRKYSLDELPQLWNVVRGDLSLVGPRPELPHIVAQYEDWQHARHLVKPGITGLWQVTERSDDTLMCEHVDTDLEYVHAMSPTLDVKILLMTLPVVVGLGMTGS